MAHGTFREASVRDALQAVKTELGADALVLSTALVPARGWRGWIGMREVEITARAAASEPAAAAPAVRPAVSRRRSADTGQARRGLAARLTAAGLAPALAEQVADGASLEQCRGGSLQDLRAALAAQVDALVAGEEAYARVEVFVGPPGVGKTTTIAKIAAQERARRGRPLGLIGADAFRAGAVEQLRTYASVIGAPFRVARTLEDLDKALAAGRQTMLVDTAGRSPAESGLRELRRLLGTRRGVRTHLVMAADTSVASARRILDAYAEVGADRLVISKVDEADSVSPLVALAGERGLRVSYLTTGQRVPEDLTRATPAALASALLSDRAWGWAPSA